MSMFIHNCIPTSQLYPHTVGSDHHSESVIPLHLTYAPIVCSAVITLRQRTGLSPVKGSPGYF